MLMALSPVVDSFERFSKQVCTALLPVSQKFNAAAVKLGELMEVDDED